MAFGRFVYRFVKNPLMKSLVGFELTYQSKSCIVKNYIIIKHIITI